ncbi:uncharacterized protein MAM_06858 [Metarhizium album ARSEF 1941]|uniref:Uncharacterized protein n=1 Tax=Metarhizium album (strain ARSEF 1941) TaxID=1081103 RepID=A0A0B2WNX8_METAS|nr:uncharacterized protein MAM_06858 [Metarhizium album ARSEF 1941]KHN95354.1 hypothetical protein MAM_06858 [Metarhizium album ARSEF 1941]
MALTIPTPEEPLESVPFLGDRMDWPAWFSDVAAISKALGIWRYVDPDGGDCSLSEPAKPAVPTRPQFKQQFPAREQYETDKVYELRVEQERHAQSLAAREYDVLCEQYRMDTAEYLSNLACYTAAKHDLQRLHRIIYRSIPERYRAYLQLDGAETPRDMVLCLRSRIRPCSDKERAPIAQRQLDAKLNAQPTDDKGAFIDAVALAAVELQRLKPSAFDDETAAKDLIRSLQTLDKPFADAWSRSRDGASGGRASATVLDLVEEFRYKMRMRDDKSYLEELAGVGVRPAEDKTPDPAVPNHSAQQNGVDPAKPPKKAKKATEDAAVAQEQQPKVKKNDREAPLPEKPSSKFKRKGETNGALAMQICPGCQMRHLIRADAWWESCYVYYELGGLGNVPEHFTISAKRLDMACSRLRDFPDELNRAQEWAKKRAAPNGAKVPETAEFNLW